MTVPESTTLLRATSARLERHPLLAVAGIAAAARLAFALFSFAAHDVAFVPDELQYVVLARLVAAGQSADRLVPGYSQALYDGTWPYTGVLAFLFRVIDDSRLVAQLYAAAGGVATAVLAVTLARRFMTTRFAVLAGMIVAVLPSQVLWSSVALRESLVWVCLCALGVLLAAPTGRSRWHAWSWVAAAALLLVVLLHLRSQTAVIAVWAYASSVWAVLGWRRWALALGASLLAIALPMSVGLGIGGVDLITGASSTLARTRTSLGFDAETRLEHGSMADGATDCDPKGLAHFDGRIGAEAIAATEGARTGDGRFVICDREGNRIVVEDGLGANVRYLPSGGAAVLLRPFPWERGDTAEFRLAAAENIGWYFLYAGALIGAVAAVRRHARALIFPSLLTAMILGAGALTQGNLGTAFRHRAQVLWVIAVFAALGASVIIERGRASGTSSHRH